MIRIEIKRKKMRKVWLDLLYSEFDYIDRKMYAQLNKE